ncbi:MAG: conjugal transfer protein [Rickettsia sp.]|nr:conjugal transfer protein [Rickettsia sp.]
MLDEIKAKAQKFAISDDFRRLQSEFKDRAKKSANRPKKVEGLEKATEHRIWYVDPTYLQPTDIKDNEGKVIVKAGTSVNPLENFSWEENWIVIDGDDEVQVSWALEQKGDIVLTNGAPLELANTHNRYFYFDQNGEISKKLRLRFLPTIVSQEDFFIKIEEFAL